MVWALCIVLLFCALLYMREIADIALIILLGIGVERLSSLVGGFHWQECVIFGVFMLPVVIFFLREASDQHSGM